MNPLDLAKHGPVIPVIVLDRVADAVPLAEALVAEDAEIAMAATLEDGRVQVQPVFCLMNVAVKPSLAAFTASGQRKIDRWTAMHRCVEVRFDDPLAFFNANTPGELQQLQTPAPAP